VGKVSFFGAFLQQFAIGQQAFLERGFPASLERFLSLNGVRFPLEQVGVGRVGGMLSNIS